jgi:hypothetical protein
MNGWDAFTWFNSIVLVAGTLAVFLFFLRDAGKFLKLGERDKE